MSFLPLRKRITCILLFLIVLCVSAPTGCYRKDSDSAEVPTPVLNGPPRTTFPMPPTDAAEMGWMTADDQRAKLADYKGRVLVLDFYATWCVPCRQSIPHLIDLQGRFGSQGLEIVGLNVGGPEDRVKIPEFSKELNIEYPLGVPDKSLTDLFLSDTDVIPQTFVFDRAGKLVKRFIGYSATIAADLEQTIQTALASTVENAEESH